MKIEFAHKEITEYTNGNFHVVNTGEAFDVPHGSASAFLAAKHTLDSEVDPKTGKLKTINVFKPSIVDGNVKEIVDPENPNAETPDLLVKTHSREALLDMAKEYGLDGDNYTNKLELATAILAVKGDK